MESNANLETSQRQTHTHTHTQNYQTTETYQATHTRQSWHTQNTHTIHKSYLLTDYLRRRTELSYQFYRTVTV